MSRPQRLRAGAVGAQRDGVAAVRQQMGRLDRRHARQARRAARPGRACAGSTGGELAGVSCSARHLARRALVQQRRHRLDARIAHAPAARRARQQHVGERDDAHPLVMRHEGLDPGDALAARLARRRVVERLDEAVAAARPRRLEAAQVGGGAVRRDLRGERGGVRRDHQLVDRRAAQRQGGNALRRVLVGEGVVAAGVGRLRDAPGHVMAPARRRSAPPPPPRDAEWRTLPCGSSSTSGRHQVLEHRPRPRAQAGEVAAGEEAAGRARPSGRRARRPWRSPTGWWRAPPRRAGRRSRRRADARRPESRCGTGGACGCRGRRSRARAASRWQVAAMAPRRAFGVAVPSRSRRAERKVARRSRAPRRARCAALSAALADGLGAATRRARRAPRRAAGVSAARARRRAARADRHRRAGRRARRRARPARSRRAARRCAPSPRAARGAAPNRRRPAAWRAARQACATAIRCMQRLPLSTRRDVLRQQRLRRARCRTS